VSVIVPLYGRIDLIEHQLAAFAADPEFRAVDLIYVLDSPPDASALCRLLPQLHALYGVCFRLVLLRQNCGYAGANNAGASIARAPLLLLLNSDVFPVGAGWLGQMARCYRDTPSIGTLGPKLLFEDESLQHAGMFFDREPEFGEWENRHFFKGFHRALPAANETRVVPAVTGACLLIDTALFQSIGGLSSDYVYGDYEDSDLSLRLTELGYQHWYIASVELYHLEAQSYGSSTRRAASRFNRRLQHSRWAQLIDRVMTSHALAPQRSPSSDERT
jgi:GT2 family glycosyltransferase